MDKWLDGIISNGIGGAMNVNTDKGVIQGVYVIIFGEDTMRENGRGIGQRGRRASIGRRASVGSVAHHYGWLGGVRRNQYSLYVSR